VAAAGVSQVAGPSYLLRLDHFNFEGRSCALLKDDGAFHLELSNGNETKVFEGRVSKNDLLQVERSLQDRTLSKLSQRQIEEPLIQTSHDELQISVFREGNWQDLFFQSGDSQQLFQHWLWPLIRWFNDLHKLPHRELSEDQGKNNCLPSKEVVLKRRGSSSANSVVPDISSAPARFSPSHPPPVEANKTATVQSLLRLYSFETKAGNAHQSCVLIDEEGKYRFEDRKQKAGKPMNTEIIAGKIGREELQQLHQLLEDPSLARIRHHEPPGGMVVSMLGDMLSASISRPNGVQHVILSSAFSRPGFPSFYPGDADISTARALLKFLSEHVENNKLGVLNPASRNDCAEAP